MIILKNGYAFVDIIDRRDADDAVHDLNGKELLGDRVSMEFARGTPRGRDNHWGGGGGYDRSPRRDDRGGGRNTNRPGPKTDYRLRVENLSTRVSWQDLKDVFRRIGDVTYCTAHDKASREGVVEFAHKSDMLKALDKYQDKDLEGRKIKLSLQYPEHKRSRSRSRSRSRKSSRSRTSRSRSSSRGSARSAKKSPKHGSASPDGEDKPKDESNKRSRSRSASADRNGNGDAKSPSPKRERKDSENSNKSKSGHGSD